MEKLVSTAVAETVEHVQRVLSVETEYKKQERAVIMDERIVIVHRERVRLTVVELCRILRVYQMEAIHMEHVMKLVEILEYEENMTSVELSSMQMIHVIDLLVLLLVRQHDGLRQVRQLVQVNENNQERSVTVLR